ncbi:MAG: Vms1/Ankzf1 family peptidyl-tRNA hydrolase [Chloroflexota bacterium]|nr:Vms1/Ankzf1 family peptidyl-tRNA hydrolase [Chloroflexota bacterium]
MSISHRRKLNRIQMLRLLDELEAAPGLAVSLYVPPGAPASEIEKTLTSIPDVEDLLPDIINTCARSATGAALFWGEHRKYLVLPPFPITDRLFSSGYTVEPLRSLLQRERTIALILIRLGSYAIGVFQGEKLLSSKVGTGHIHSRHKKGGSSQRRFERGREKQIEYFFDRVCGHVREHLEPFIQQLDHVVYGGERHTLLSFRKQCQFLTAIDDRSAGKLLNIREPRQSTLEAAISEVWASEVIDLNVEDMLHYRFMGL